MDVPRKIATQYCTNIQLLNIIGPNHLESRMDAPVKALNTEKAKALAAALSQIEKQFGKGSIMRLGAGEVVDAVEDFAAPIVELLGDVGLRELERHTVQGSTVVFAAP